MRLMFVADGERDRVIIPEVVKNRLNATVDATFREWKQLRLTRGSGYKRRLRLALLQARDQETQGVVATVDCDTAKHGERLSLLRAARDDDRNSPGVAPIPTAVGEAIPHVEAWLLDDSKAIRDALQFRSDKHIPSVGSCDPKSELNALMDECSRTEGRMELLAEIARQMDLRRCNHSATTGFAEFVEDLEKELAPLVSARS